MPSGTLSRAPVPYVQGRFQHVLTPPGQERAQEADPEGLWFVNDHCFFVTDDSIHWFGITNPYPADGKYYGPGTHLHIGHASASHPFGPWQEHPDALCLPQGTDRNIGASFVVKSDAEYLMFYGYNAGLNLGRSLDLFHWEPVENRDKILLGRGRRDPCIIQLGPNRYLLYGAAGHAGYGAVPCATSANLLDWQVERPALVSDVSGDWGPLESPFAIERQRSYYLFVNHSHHQYEETLVFVSEDPQSFEWVSRCAPFSVTPAGFSPGEERPTSATAALRIAIGHRTPGSTWLNLLGSNRDIAIVQRRRSN